MNFKNWFGGALLVGLLFVLSDLVKVQKTPQERFVPVAAESIPKTVTIEVTGLMEMPMLTFDGKNLKIKKVLAKAAVRGSGVFISPQAHVLSCAHLFWSFNKIQSITVCNSDGVCTAGELLKKTDNRDLALLNTFFDKPTPYARLGDPRELKVGQEVLAIGNPLGLPFTVTHGILSRLGTDEVGYNMTQSDAFINPGNSGGPLFNLAGELVGINSRMVPPVNASIFTGLGFSVSPSQIAEFLIVFKDIDKSLPKYNSKYWGMF